MVFNQPNLWLQNGIDIMELIWLSGSDMTTIMNTI